MNKEILNPEKIYSIKKVFIIFLTAIILLALGTQTVLYFNKETKVIDSKILPEKEISPEELSKKPAANSQKKCGDGTCDNVEKSNPNICPQDCKENQTNGSESVYQKDYELISNLKYSSIDSEAVKLDLFLPNDCLGKLPLIIMIHGGAFKSGDKKDIRNQAEFTRNCYAVASLNYRLSGEAKFPAGNQDVKSAVRWLKAHAFEYNLDEDNFGAMGSSAGAYYASFLGTTEGVNNFDVGDNLGFSSSVQAVVDEFGPVNLSTLAQDRIDMGAKSQSFEIEYFGCDISSTNCEAGILASPVEYISKNDVPFLILHGEKDNQIPIAQSRDFHAQLLNSGVESEFITVPNAGHGGPQFIEYLPQIIAFFDKHLKD